MSFVYDFRTVTTSVDGLLDDYCQQAIILDNSKNCWSLEEDTTTLLRSKRS